MKNPVNPKILPLFTLTAGVLGLIFRFWLFSSAIDEKGLLVPSHPANYLIYILTAITLVVLLLAARKCPTSTETGIPGSRLAALGALMAAVITLVTDILEYVGSDDIMITISFGAGIAAALALIYLGKCRLTVTPAPLLAPLVLTLYFALHLIVQYRAWSSEPQLQNYFFPLMASVCLMLYSYYRATADYKHKSLRCYLWFGHSALFFCFLSLNTESWLFYIGMILWTATDLYIPQANPQPVPTEEA